MNKKSKKYIFNYNMMFINIISILIFILMVIITFWYYKSVIINYRNVVEYYTSFYYD